MDLSGGESGTFWSRYWEKKNLANPHPIIIGHMVLDELWPLVLKHSCALARLAAAHGSDYWAAHGDAFAAPRSLRGGPQARQGVGLVLRQPVLAGCIWDLCCATRHRSATRSRHWLLLGPVRPRAASALIGAGHHEADIIHFFVGSAGGRRRRGAGARNERHLAVPVQVPASSLGTRRPGCPRCRTSEALTRPRSTRGFTETRHAVVVDGQAGHHRR